MAYTITPEQAKTIEDADMAFGTTKFLPKVEDIPEDFKRYNGNIYVEITESLFFGKPLPGGEAEPINGFDLPTIQRVVLAHLRSWEPKHEHKVAGVAYMISLMTKVTEDGQG